MEFLLELGRQEGFSAETLTPAEEAEEAADPEGDPGRIELDAKMIDLLNFAEPSEAAEPEPPADPREPPWRPRTPSPSPEAAASSTDDREERKMLAAAIRHGVEKAAEAERERKAARENAEEVERKRKEKHDAKMKRREDLGLGKKKRGGHFKDWHNKRFCAINRGEDMEWWHRKNPKPEHPDD